MQTFLEVQKATMLAYLNGRGSPSPVVDGPRSAVGGHGREADRAGGGHEASAPRPEPNGVWPRGSERAQPEPATSSGHASDSIIPCGSNGSTAAPNRTPEPVAPEPAPTPAAPDRAAITERLLEIVRQRTGYPLETLGLDLDVEADLGIDSIKRVEILGKLRDEFPTLRGVSDSAEVMDDLAQARTLRAIVDRMAATAAIPASQPSFPSLTQGGPEGIEPPREGPGGVEAPGTAHGAPGPTVNGPVEPGPRALRRVLEIVAAPLPRQRLGLMAGGRLLVTDDGRGVAEALTHRLQAAGVPAECWGGPDRPLDWSSPAAIESLVDRVRSRGPIAGVVHARPLGQSTAGDPGGSNWSERLAEAVKGLFLLARATAADLEAAAQAGGACLIAATAMGGRFATHAGGAGTAGRSAEGALEDFFPGHGGVAGLVKTLAREWPIVRCRAVDLDPEAPAVALAERLADEIFAGDGWAEVGYDRGRRIRLRAVPGPLRRTGAALELAPGDPVLISGGARGITARVAAELARAWKPTLLILGTTPLTVADESEETAGLTDEAEIKAALHARLRRDGRPGGPARIEAIYQSLRRSREVRANLELLRRAEATVDYAVADVRDPRALDGILDAWRARHGQPVGLIHGAGLIQDKLIRAKTPESFDRVLGTKVGGALNLLRRVDPDALRFTVLFSSIAGRFGNVGQSDYAAANEVLNKLALWLDRRWPGRVVSLIWGPWSGVGMVSQLESLLGSRGLGLIAPDVGPTLLIDELRYGRKGDVEVIQAAGLGTLEQPIAGAGDPEPAAPVMEAVP
jgi:hypothetical protein